MSIAKTMGGRRHEKAPARTDRSDAQRQQDVRTVRHKQTGLLQEGRLEMHGDVRAGGVCGPVRKEVRAKNPGIGGKKIWRMYMRGLGRQYGIGRNRFYAKLDGH